LVTITVKNLMENVLQKHSSISTRLYGTTTQCSSEFCMFKRYKFSLPPSSVHSFITLTENELKRK